MSMYVVGPHCCSFGIN